jgi:hypothetical protein
MNTPDRIAKLPIDRRNFAVPWFVEWINGEPDFRVVDAHKIGEAIRYRKCWICGERLGRFLVWLIGPMCIINRTSAEPPSHRDCAEYAVRVCPFLANPNMRRNEHKLPPETVSAAGHMLRRNPGLSLSGSANHIPRSVHRAVPGCSFTSVTRSKCIGIAKGVRRHEPRSSNRSLAVYRLCSSWLNKMGRKQ